MTVSPTLDKRFREAAAAAGLLDVAYDLAETPIGTLLVATTERGLCRISYDPQPEREAEWLAQAFGVRVLRATKPIDPVRRQLDEYFEGTRTAFELPVDLRQSAPFSRDVLQRLAKVPYGQVTTYGALAACGPPAAGRPRSRHGHEPEPDPDRAPVPSGGRRERLARRLRRRPRAQGEAPEARRRA